MRSRLPYALAAVGLGTTIAIAGVGMRLDLPFFAMLFCALACAFCIDRIARAAFPRKSRHHKMNFPE